MTTLDSVCHSLFCLILYPSNLYLGFPQKWWFLKKISIGSTGPAELKLMGLVCFSILALHWEHTETH